MSEAELEKNVLEDFEKLVELTNEYEVTNDRDLLKIPESLELYVNTNLGVSEISQIVGISERKLAEWVDRYEFDSVRKSVHGKFDLATIDYLNARTVEVLLSRSDDVESQIRAMGNRLVSKAYKEMDSNELKPKDLIHYALKYKELEAKVTGKIQSAPTNINIDNTLMYKKIMDGGLDAPYTAREVVEAEVLEVPESHRLPEKVEKDIDSHKELFTNLSDEEIDEYIGKE